MARHFYGFLRADDLRDQAITDAPEIQAREYAAMLAVHVTGDFRDRPDIAAMAVDDDDAGQLVALERSDHFANDDSEGCLGQRDAARHRAKIVVAAERH